MDRGLHGPKDNGETGTGKALSFDDAELDWEESYRHPHLLRSPAGRNHRWNPTNYPGNKVGGVIVQDWVDPGPV